MYIFFRVIVLFIFIILFIIIFHKKIKAWIQLKRNILWILLGFIIFFHIITLIPLEISVISFQTPEEALHYMEPTAKLIQVIESNDGAFILYKKGGDKFLYTYVNQVNGEWKARNPYKRLQMSIEQEEKVSIKKIKNDEENLQLIALSALDIREDVRNFNIYDNYDSDFIYCESPLTKDGKYKVKFLLTIVQYPHENLYLYVDGKEVYLD